MNVILNSDSYKYSQFNQYPEGTEYVYSYIESRGGQHDETVFFGLQGFIKAYLTKPITMEDIVEAEELITAHGLPFYREGWEHILNEHEGMLPVHIRAVKEGTVVPTSNVLVDIVNTDPACYWLTSFLETALLRAVWYPTTVATNSREIKKIILEALEDTGTPELIDFKLHDFGARGVSSEESAAIGSLAHLVNFKGSDTISGILYGRKYYNEHMAALSIPAMEHSTVTSWGREGELDSYRNMIKKNAVKDGLFACVSDSYDIYQACEDWGTQLKDDVIASGATLVVRPDSGHPATVVTNCALILERGFGSTKNLKGYKVLNNVRIIQGDGITRESVVEILETLKAEGFSADNVTFGLGGGLLQIVNRDDQRFAMKCSAIKINGEHRDVFKDPITDSGKRSKKGLLKLIKLEDGFNTVNHTHPMFDKFVDYLEPVFKNGELLRDQSLEEIRINAAI